MFYDFEELQKLRDGTIEGELAYRARVMGLIGAEREPSAEEFHPGRSPGRLPRRVEGMVRIPRHPEPALRGAVMFATGNRGLGNLSDIRSKDGGMSARRALLNRSDVDFVLLVTELHPTEDMLVEARRYGSSASISDGALEHRVPAVWVIGAPELLHRAEIAAGMVRIEPAAGWWQRLRYRWFGTIDEPVRTSPLLVSHPGM